jgi:ketosteroid isomerase-like protein
MVSVREALESGGFEPHPDLLAPDVVWIGRFPGELCRNRDEVLEMFRLARENGIEANPEIVWEQDDTLVVDPHLDGRHQVIVVRDGVVSEVRAYVSRDAAVAAVEKRPW